MIRRGSLGLALAAALFASLAFTSIASAGITTNQTVAKSGQTVTWTGGAANDATDPNADAVTFAESPAGTVTITAQSGTLTLLSSPDADADCTQDDESTVTCDNTTTLEGTGSDGADTIDGSGLTTIAMSTMSGGPGNDVISGGEANDVIKGDAGNDTINGNGGDDDLKGSDGNDTVNGGPGDDREVAGGRGDDIVNGDDGNDYMRGGPDNDTLNGGPGDDEIYGACDGGCENNVGEDRDTLNGGDGRDYLDGEDGNDTINAGNDSDFANGGIGDDVINGDAGDDNGNCLLNACCVGARADGFCGSGGLVGGPGNDTIHGGEGDDSIMGFGFYVSGDIEEPDNDQLFGDGGSDYIDGGPGDDLVDGGAGDDAETSGYADFDGGLHGGPGNDTVRGGDGIDTLYGDAGDDNLDGGAGDDAYHYYGNVCQADGGCYLYVYGGVWGGDDNDTATGGPGRDFVYGDSGDDNVTGGPGDDTWRGWYSGNYSSDSYSQYPGVYGGDGDDTVRGGDGADYLDAGYGKDNTDGEAGDDEIYEYDEGSPDVVHGGPGVDTLWYWSCCSGAPVTLTLDDQADDGEAAQPETKDSGDPGNNFASDIENLGFDTNCNTPCDDGGYGGVSAPAKIVGTSGANLLYGSAGDDDITGGDGADYMSGGDGADTFHARDGYPDYVDCDNGVDTAIVDQFDTVHNCENVDLANVKSAFDLDNPPTPPTPPPAQQAGGPPPDTTAPKVTLKLPKSTFTPDQFVLGVRVSAACNEDCMLSLRLLAQQQPGRATFSRAKGYNVVVGRRTVGFGKSKKNIRVRPCERRQGGPQSKACLERFKKAVNARLKKAGKVTMKLIVVTTDRAGNRTTKTRTITIKRPRK